MYIRNLLEIHKDICTALNVEIHDPCIMGMVRCATSFYAPNDLYPRIELFAYAGNEKGITINLFEDEDMAIQYATSKGVCVTPVTNQEERDFYGTLFAVAEIE